MTPGASVRYSSCRNLDVRQYVISNQTYFFLGKILIVKEGGKSVSYRCVFFFGGGGDFFFLSFPQNFQYRR